MFLWSLVFMTEGSSSSSDNNEFKQWTKCSGNIMNALRCYVCGNLFHKPRILPCGHTYCAKCILNLRETAVQEFNKSCDKTAHRRGDCGFFTCPWPHCHYSMRIMNVSRWTLENKAVSQAVSMAKKQEEIKQTDETQTETNQSNVLLSIPKTLFQSSTKLSMSNRPVSPMAMAVQYCLQQTMTTEYIPIEHFNPPPSVFEDGNQWKSYAFLFGMALIDQVLKMP